MGITLGSTTSSDSIRRTSDFLLRATERLSSGRRINRASDDAAGLAISEKLRAAVRALEQGARNLNDGISVSRTAESALSSSSDLVIRMRELTVQAGNGTLDDSARAAIQQEFDALSQEVTRIAESTTFNGRHLLNGESSGASAITLRDGTGGDDIIPISIDDQRASALGVEGLDVSDSSTLDALDGALAQISGARSELGAVENRLRSGIRQIQQLRQSTAQANSRIADADFAIEAAAQARDQVLQQAQVAVQAQANIASSLALSLLT